MGGVGLYGGAAFFEKMSDTQIIQLPIQTREATYEGSNKDTRLVHFTFATENAVQRSFGLEILSLEPSAVDVERLEAGVCPLLYNHDFERSIGAVVSYRIGTTTPRKAYGTAKLGTSPLAEQTLRDMQSGTRPSISVGYLTKSMKLLKAGQGDEPDTYLVTRWTPCEVSSVPCPLDPQARLDRSLDNRLYDVRVEVPSTVPSTRSIPPEIFTSADPKNTMTTKQLESIATDRHLPWYATQSNSSPGYCRTVRENYSLSKLLLSSLDTPSNSWEAEVSAEIARRTQRTPSGFWVPLNALLSRDLSATVSGAGEETVEQRLSHDLVRALIPMSVVLNLGGTLVENVKSPITFPRMDTTATVQWL